MEKKNYQDILNEINITVKKNLSELKKPIDDYINYINEKSNILLKDAKIIIDNFFNENDFNLTTDFKKYITINISNSIEDLYNNIIGSSESIVNIVKNKGIIESIISIFSSNSYLGNIINILEENYISKLNMKLDFIERIYPNYISNNYYRLDDIINTCEINFNKEQKKLWKELQKIYKDKKEHIINENKLFKETLLYGDHPKIFYNPSKMPQRK